MTEVDVSSCASGRGQRWSRPRILAHRVADLAVPFALPALAEQLDGGSDGLAIDVSATRDGVLVAADDALVRAAGLAPVAQLRWDELAQVDFGSVLGGKDGAGRMSLVTDVLARFTDAFIALRFARVDDELVAAVTRCQESNWSRTLLIAPSVPTARMLQRTAPGALRVAVGDPALQSHGVDGIAAEVRAFSNVRPGRGLRIGLGCDTAASAEMACSERLDIALTSRPRWLAESFARIGALDDALH